MKKITVGLLAISFCFCSCGSKDKSKEGESNTVPTTCDFGDIACGVSIASIDDQISISFEKAAAGDKYIVMPYSVGNIDTVDGAGATKFSFEVPAKQVTTPAADENLSVFDLKREDYPQLSNDQYSMLRKNRDAAGQMIYGKYRPSMGVDGQVAGFWSLVNIYDSIDKKLQKAPSFDVYGKKQTSLRDTFLTGIKKEPLKGPKLTSLAAGACPVDDVVIPTSDGDTDVVDVDSANVVSGSDYCIVYVDDPKSETDRNMIKASIEKLMNIYKTVIYKDDFAASGAFTFKPNFIIIDPSNPSYNMPTSFLGFLGVFVAQTSDEVGMPTLYIASDLSKISGLENDAAGKNSFHATMAHELQHAISYYYRAFKNVASGAQSSSLLQTTFVDEGLAHLMEDVFGYGSEEFADYAGNYIANSSYGLHPFLGGTLFPTSEFTGSNAAVFAYYRGAAQAFIYYLATRKGSFDFENGVISGGAGLQYLADLTTSSLQGAKNLRDTFAHATWSWNDTVSNFLIASVVDHSSLSNVITSYTLPKVFKEVIDLQGTKNKVFGMRFNNFNSIQERTSLEIGLFSPYEPDAVNGTTKEVEVYHYHTIPGLVTVSNSAQAYVIDSADDVGTAAAVVRVK